MLASNSIVKYAISNRDTCQLKTNCERQMKVQNYGNKKIIVAAIPTLGTKNMFDHFTYYIHLLQTATKIKNMEQITHLY